MEEEEEDGWRRRILRERGEEKGRMILQPTFYLLLRDTMTTWRIFDGLKPICCFRSQAHAGGGWAGVDGCCRKWLHGACSGGSAACVSLALKQLGTAKSASLQSELPASVP